MNCKINIIDKKKSSQDKRVSKELVYTVTKDVSLLNKRNFVEKKHILYVIIVIH